MRPALLAYGQCQHGYRPDGQPHRGRRQALRREHTSQTSLPQSHPRSNPGHAPPPAACPARRSHRGSTGSAHETYRTNVEHVEKRRSAPAQIDVLTRAAGGAEVTMSPGFIRHLASSLLGASFARLISFAMLPLAARLYSKED